MAGSGAMDLGRGISRVAHMRRHGRRKARRRSTNQVATGATTIAHGVLVGWSAARVEHRGRVWKSARELALERERWAITMRCERGYTTAAA